MNKFSRIATISVLALTATACSGEADAPEADNVTETQMDDVDVIDGTINDDMVDVDTQASGDEMAEGEEGADASADTADEKGNGAADSGE